MAWGGWVSEETLRLRAWRFRITAGLLHGFIEGLQKGERKRFYDIMGYGVNYKP